MKHGILVMCIGKSLRSTVRDHEGEFATYLLQLRAVERLTWLLDSWVKTSEHSKLCYGNLLLL